ncbi:hypothetical protein [Halorhabdus amylolytica]|uniref:hypothetical protein n=1 Tax=Halorhabdus amylolytica TaxID=2559573 RepID=UPI0010AB3296
MGALGPTGDTAGDPRGTSCIRDSAEDRRRQGTSDFGTVGYRGSAPPEDDGPHTYRFTMTALESALSIEPRSGRSTVRSAMDGTRLGQTTTTATDDR